MGAAEQQYGRRRGSSGDWSASGLGHAGRRGSAVMLDVVNPVAKINGEDSRTNIGTSADPRGR